MDMREILVRYKEGSLDRGSASQLLGSFTVGERPLTRDRALTAPPEPHDPWPAPEVAAGPQPVAAGDPPATDTDVDTVAVVGMAGRYPQAADLTAFWQNLREGRDTSTDVPPVRPGAPLLSSGQRGYFLDAVDEFDPEFFGLTEEEGRLMDPQERLFLETAWEALENAGRTGARLDALTGADGQPRAVGVFVGADSADYALIGAESWARGGRETPRSGHWGLAGRLAGLLALRGPAQAVDTSWSSGLVAVHLAVQALRRGDCAAAVAGGVELLLHPSRARWGSGEGVGAVVLRPLRDAVADGDQVYAVIRATSAGACAHAPSATGRGPEAIGLRETRDSTVRRIGDAGAATGIAALTSAVLQLRHSVLAPARDGAEAQPWRESRRAVVEFAPDAGDDSAAGLQARIVVEEFVPRTSGAAGTAQEDLLVSDGVERDVAVLLSAPTPRHLAAAAQRLVTWLDDADRAAVDLPALARGLRVGRSAQPCRIALVVRTVPQLLSELRAFLRNEGAVDLRDASGDPLGLGALPETADYLAALWRGGRIEQLTRLWLSGVAVDWAGLEAEGGDRPAAAPLPTSVFLRRPLWLGRAEPQELEG